MSRAGGTVRVAVVILAGLLALSGCAPIPVQQTAADGQLSLELTQRPVFIVVDRDPTGG